MDEKKKLDTATNPDNPRRKINAHAIRDASIRASAAQGIKTADIAKAHNITRQSVSEILNSKETTAIVKALESKLTLAGDKAMDVVQWCMENRDKYPAEALRAATSVLKSIGVFREKLDVTHTIPKPTVIKRRDGSTVILGTEDE